MGVIASADLQKGMTAFMDGNYTTALSEWTPHSEQGNADAQNNLGEIYQTGLGAAKDYKTAVEWYKFAAAQGNTPAQNNLGNMYKEG